MNDKYNKEESKHIFFTSDTHFGHENIIKFCNRPFKDADEMNEALINNWNNKVGKDDIVYHLGDFAIGGSYIWNNTLNALNGKIILIIGNHDEKYLRQGYVNKFKEVLYQDRIIIEGRTVYLNHYPFLCYGGSYRKERDAVYALSGHVHVTKFDNTGKDFERLQYLFPYQYDVGVDFNDYTPISWAEVKNKINTQVKLNKNLLYWVNS